jgi:hypothetical protein
MRVKVRWLQDVPEFKRGEESYVDDQYAGDMAAIGACVLLEPDPRSPAGGHVVTGAMEEPRKAGIVSRGTAKSARKG